MNLCTKQIKDLETKIHGKLHTNIQLLTHIYPTTKEFDEVFKKNMFVRSNKTAFQHVTHYLFNILNPELTKVKITAWPLYDTKLETMFRNEVIAFINHINIVYEHANIPNLMASHLVSPGGLKFAKFILKLSMLVIYEHLKKSEDIEVSGPIQPHKNPTVTNIVRENFKEEINLVNSETVDMYANFLNLYNKGLQEAEAIVEEQTQTEKDLSNVSKILREKQAVQEAVQTKDALTERLNQLQEKMKIMEKNKTLCEKGIELLEYLANDRPVLHFKKEEFVVPASVKHLFKPDHDKLNLVHLFKSSSVLVENEIFEMPTFTTQQLNEITKSVRELYEKCRLLDHKLTANKNELVEMSDYFFSSKVAKNLFS